MTAAASSFARPGTRPYHPWMHSFHLCLRQNAAVTALNALAFLLLYALVPAFELHYHNGAAALREPVYGYLFFTGEAAYPLQLFPWLTLESAVLQGVLAFRFLYGRAPSNAWFSLGLSRSGIFWSRFTAGAAGAVLPVVLSMLATLGFNLAWSADIGIVLARFAFFLLGMSIQILALYCITVLVCTNTNTTAEGFAYSAVLCLLPSVAVAGMNALMEKLLFGMPYVAMPYAGEGINFSLLKALSDWNPFLFMLPYMQNFGGAERAADDMSAFLLTRISHPSINWLMLLGWALVAGALAWFARLRFLRHGVEHAGVTGSVKPVAWLSVLTAGFAAFTAVYMLPFYLPRELEFWAPLAAAAACAAVAMLIMALLFRLLARPAWKGLAAWGCGLAAMLGLAGLLVSGGLGYSSFVPAAADVKTVTITYNGLSHYVQEVELEEGGFVSQDFAFSNCVTLTDEADIRVATGIHRALAEKGRLNPLYSDSGSERVYEVMTKIRYVLKSGTVVARTYGGMTAGLAKRIIELDDTQGVRQAYADSLLSPKTGAGLIDNVAAYANGSLALCSPLCSSSVALDLSDTDRSELIACIAGDLQSQPSSDRYLPDGPPVCAVALVLPDYRQEPLNPGECKTVYVTRRFTRTLAYLKSHAIPIPADRAVESVTVRWDYPYSNFFPIFTGGAVPEETVKEFEQYSGSLLTVSDPARLTEIFTRCRGVCLAADGGYIVYVKFAGLDKYYTAFLPSTDAPDFVKENAK